MYLWIKSFHIVFMVTWFAGLFYLPRLFVYHAQRQDAPTIELFKVMERRLLAIMTLGAIITGVLGVYMWVENAAYLASSGWWHAKTLLIVFLIAYHIWCWRLVVMFREDRNTRDHKWYRWFNEIPSVLILIIIPLAVLKPF